MKVVLGSGPTNSPLFICGEAPGKVEARTNIPFSGPSGDLLNKYLSLSNLPPLKSSYLTNVSKLYQDGNPDPTPVEIADWTPTLLAELEEVKPKVILAVGRYATDFFLPGVLSSTTDLETIHGIAHYTRRTDLPDYLSSTLVFPVFHPAGGLWNYERRSIIRYGYELVGESWDRIKRGLPVHIRRDEFQGLEEYLVTGQELESVLTSYRSERSIIGLDTEGIPSNPWSIQISLDPGSGYLLRCSQPDFARGISALAKYLSRVRPTIAMHQASTPTCACYDVVMCRAMGLELQPYNWFDTMYWAYLRRLESQSNKTLCNRWQDMEMEDYQSTIGDIGRSKQVSYLSQASLLCPDWPKAPKRREKQNTGKWKESQPKHIHASITQVLRDIEAGKIADGEPTNPFKRWINLKESNPTQVRQVEAALGRMPVGSLQDIPLERARDYACKDSDGSLRNALTFLEHSSPRILSLMKDGMAQLHLIETRQRNGVPVSISAITSLHAEMDREVDEIQLKMYNEYWGDQPVSSLADVPKGKEFNPNSPPQTRVLCRRLGITPALKTDTGVASTSKKSIEEYRFTIPAIADLFDFRERAHNRDTYCNDVLARVPPNYPNDLLTIRANFKPTTVPTRREAAKNPNILGIPVRTDLGKKVRNCYLAPPGKIWCGFDLSGVEVRCLAHLSRDPLLVEAFKRGFNPHKYTASLLFNTPLSTVTDLQKAVAKTINFLIIYGGGPNNLFDQFRSNNIKGYTLADCRQFIHSWYSTYAGVDSFRQRVIREAHETETSVDHWGMTRYLPGINCGDREIEAEEERAAVSQRVQGLAKGMVIKASIWLDSYLQDLIKAGELDPECWRLDVHDELDFLVNEGEQEILGELAMHALTKHCGIDLIVPVEAEAHYGRTWGALK